MFKKKKFVFEVDCHHFRLYSFRSNPILFFFLSSFHFILSRLFPISIFFKVDFGCSCSYFAIFYSAVYNLLAFFLLLFFFFNSIPTSYRTIFSLSLIYLILIYVIQFNSFIKIEFLNITILATLVCNFKINLEV